MKLSFMRRLFTALAFLATTVLLGQQSCIPPTADSYIVDGDSSDSINVCIGEVVTFDGSASYGADGLGIAEYNWNFADGSIDISSEPFVTHSFSAPGHYEVILTVVDDSESNPCSSLNFVPLDVFVSNYPTHDEFPSDTTICLGEVVELIGIYDFGVYDSTWTGFPQIYPIDGGCLPDTLLGITQSFSVTYTEFDPSDVISSLDDLGDICVNMEHSFMGDLIIDLSCPNGTTVNLLSQGGGGAKLGIPDEADNVDCINGIGIGEGWTYCWNSDATETWDDWVDAQGGFGLTIPEGTYAPNNPLTELIGCPFQGIWQLSITDNWAGDDGQVFEFGVGFAPSFYPSYTSFSNTIGEGADSSHWDLAGPYINDNSIDLNQITVQPEVLGVFDYSYWVVNNLGCEFDTTVTVEVIEGIEITAGPDIVFDCIQPVQLEGGPIPSCENVSGIYSHCYEDATEILEITYCPDVPGDGITMMTLEFLSGELGGFGLDDWVTIYNGNSASAPWMDGPLNDLTGLSYIAENSTGCITFTIEPYGVFNCAEGWIDPVEVSVGCIAIDNGMVWSWDPPTGLNNANVQNPSAIIDQTTIYTLSAYPEGFPACATTDEMELSLPIFNATIDTVYGPLAYCIGDSLTYFVESVPGAMSYQWTLPSDWNGQSFTDSVISMAGVSGIVSVRASDGCGYTNLVEIEALGFELPMASIAMLDEEFCPEDTLIAIVESSGPYDSFIWELPDESWIGDFSGDSLIMIVGDVGGVMSWKPVNICGVGTTDELLLNVIESQVAVEIIEGETEGCITAEFPYVYVVESGALEYDWIITGADISSLTTSVNSIGVNWE